MKLRRSDPECSPARLAELEREFCKLDRVAARSKDRVAFWAKVRMDAWVRFLMERVRGADTRVQLKRSRWGRRSDR